MGGISETAFELAAQVAKQTCPVSLALSGNVQIHSHTRLEAPRERTEHRRLGCGAMRGRPRPRTGARTGEATEAIRSLKRDALAVITHEGLQAW
jgi:hypothetical protein